MDIEFDPAKDAANIAKHGVSLEMASEMDMDLAIVGEDRRADYGEDRFIAVGPINGRLHVLIYTPRGEKVRIISLGRLTPGNGDSTPQAARAA